MTLIYEKYPKKLPSNKQTTYGFCIEHHMAGDLMSALAEATVMELADDARTIGRWMVALLKDNSGTGYGG